MDLTFNRMERVVGTFVIGIAILLLSTLIVIGRGKNWFEKSIIYYTVFNEGYNLQENTPVKLFKADIGTVKQITLAENKVRVKLAILQKYQTRIRTDAVAVVESPTFIGSEYVSIIPGKGWANPIPPEGEIPSRERKSISDILDEFQVEKTGKMVVQAIQNLAELTETLNDPQGPLHTALNNLASVSANVEAVTAGLKKGEGTLGSLVSTRELMDTVLARLNQVELILSNVGAATAKTPQSMDHLNTASRDINGIVSQVATVVTDIQAAAQTLNVILENVKSGSRDVPHITSTAKKGIAEIRDGVANIDKVVQSLQKNILIRGNLPQDPTLNETTTGLRQ